MARPHRRLLCRLHPLAAAGAGDLLVLLPGALYRTVADRRVAADHGRRLRVLADHLHHLRGGVFLRDHARRHPVDLEGPAGRGQRARPDLRAVDALRRAAAGVPQHAAGAADANHRAVPGHLAGLRAVDPGFPRRRQQGRTARRPSGRNVPVRRAGLLRHFLCRVVRRPPPAVAYRHCKVAFYMRVSVRGTDSFTSPKGRGRIASAIRVRGFAPSLDRDPSPGAARRPLPLGEVKPCSLLLMRTK